MPRAPLGHGRVSVRAVRAGLVGGGTSLMDLGGVVLLHQGLGMPLGPAAALAFALSSAVHFVLHRSWVFASTGCPRRQGARYLGLLSGGFAVTAVAVPLLAGLALDYRLAKVLVTVLVGLGNVALLQVWVFAHRPPAPARVHVPRGLLTPA